MKMGLEDEFYDTERINAALDGARIYFPLAVIGNITNSNLLLAVGFGGLGAEITVTGYCIIEGLIKKYREKK